MRLLDLVQLCLVVATTTSANFESRPLVSYPHSEVQCVNNLCRCNSNTVTCSCAGKFSQVLDLHNQSYPRDMRILKIENCGSVTIRGYTFGGLKNLATIEISNVSHLDVDEGAFKWRERFDPNTPIKGIIITLKNVTIEELPASAFSGNLDAVVMEDIVIKTMRTFAFMDVWQIGRIEMSRFEISLMEESVAKKMQIKTFRMTDGIIRGIVPTRAFTDLDVESEFILENVRFDIIQSKALILKIHETFRMRNCYITQLRGDAFDLLVHDQIIFERNYFGAIDMRALYKIIPERPPPDQVHHRGVTFIFDNNTIGDFQDGALEIQQGFRHVRMERVVLQRGCNCDDLDNWRTRLVTADPGTSVMESSSLWCHVESTRGYRRATPVDDFYRHACVEKGWDIPAVLITAAMLGAALLCFVGIGTLCCKRYRHKKLKKSPNGAIPLKRVNSSKRTPGDGASHGVTTYGVDEVMDGSEETRPLKMIIPDGRTYRETELHVIVERAEPLPESTLTGAVPPRKQSSSSSVNKNA